MSQKNYFVQKWNWIIHSHSQKVGYRSIDFHALSKLIMHPHNKEISHNHLKLQHKIHKQNCIQNINSK